MSSSAWSLRRDCNEFTQKVDFFLQDGPLSSGDYRFEVTNNVEDRAGNKIDGNGDGSGGDPFQRFFTLDLPAEFVLEGPSNDSQGTQRLYHSRKILF